jgi:hypothetical protein
MTGDTSGAGTDYSDGRPERSQSLLIVSITRIFLEQSECEY